MVGAVGLTGSVKSSRPTQYAKRKTKYSEQYMKILVTGASGFIGGRFARFALEQGLDVRVTGRRA
jgi:hypothetical protein